MKYFYLIIIALFCAAICTPSQAQFIDKLKKKAKETSRKVENKVDNKVDKKIDDVINGTPKEEKDEEDNGTSDSTGTPQGNAAGGLEINHGNNDLEINSGGGSLEEALSDGQVVFFDNFKDDKLGDFPLHWNTNGSGEVVEALGSRYLYMRSGSNYIPLLEDLGPDYVLEFDLLTAGLDYDGLAGSSFTVRFMDEKTLNNYSSNYTDVWFSLWVGSNAPDAIHFRNHPDNNTVPGINNAVDYKLTPKLNGKVHLTYQVNGQRFRFYVDGQKVVDVPNLIPDNASSYLQMLVDNIDESKGHKVLIKDIRVTEIEEDLRALLIKYGGFSTTKILFETNSAQLSSESHTYLARVGKLLKDDPSLNMIIVGHTDSDGEEKANQVLSEKRAASVKAYLVETYGVEENRLQVMGKGEAEPLNANSTPQEKAANRRVEFKKV